MPLNITKTYNATSGTYNYTITLNTSSDVNPFNRTFNWTSLDTLGDICYGWGSLCPFNESNFNNSYWLPTLLLAPWILTEYTGKVLYLEMWNINNNMIAFVNDGFYYYLGYTIPYMYWWSTAILLSIGTFYMIMGLTVGGFCAAETFSPSFVAWLASN